MRVIVALLVCAASWAWQPARAETVTRLHASYAVHAGGLHVADVEVVLATDMHAYHMELAYHTTGLAGFFYRGHQFNSTDGLWERDRAIPQRHYGSGVWRGQSRLVLIDYIGGVPVLRRLDPPNETEREPIPAAASAESVDTLSALMDLIRTVDRTGRCETSARVYDGRRVSEIAARTSGDENVAPTDRSIFAGRALRCDFEGRLVAGFRLDGGSDQTRRPLHGSAWFAQMAPGSVRLPVRMTFETRWFGEATMLLTAADPNADRRPVER